MDRILCERRRAGRHERDCMQALMETRYADGRLLRDEEITGLLLTALFAGQHTSGVLAAWVGIDLLRHREYPRWRFGRDRGEYAEGEALSLDTLKRQTVLERAIREGERLHPPAHRLGAPLAGRL